MLPFHVISDQLRQNVNTRQMMLNVNLTDLTAFDPALAANLVAKPGEFLPRLEAAVAEAAKQVQRTQPDEIDERARTFQVTLQSDANLVPIRALTVRCPGAAAAAHVSKRLTTPWPLAVFRTQTQSTHIARLVRVPGIVIAAHSVQAKATRIHIICRQCGNSMNLALKTGLTGVQLPRSCPGCVWPCKARRAQSARFGHGPRFAHALARPLSARVARVAPGRPPRSLRVPSARSIRTSSRRTRASTSTSRASSCRKRRTKCPWASCRAPSS